MSSLLPRAAFLVVSLSLAVACVAAACSPAPAPVVAPSPPAPLASASSVSEPDVAVREAPADPNVVRCGVDDRPRAILGAWDDDAGDRSHAKRQMAVAAPPAIAVPMPAGSAPPPPAPTPRATAKLAAPKLLGGAATPAALASAFAASDLDLDGCEALATTDDEGAFELTVALASGGATLAVSRAAAPKPTPYVRCVMERACRLRGDEGASRGDVVVPIAVRWNFPKLRGKAPTQAGAQAPRTFFEARDDANASKHGFFRTLRVLVRQDARGCAGQPDGAELRVTVTLAKGKAPRVVSAKSEALAPGIADGVAECIAERLKGRTLPDRPAGFVDSELALIVAW